MFALPTRRATHSRRAETRSARCGEACLAKAGRGPWGLFLGWLRVGFVAGGALELAGLGCVAWDVDVHRTRDTITADALRNEPFISTRWLRPPTC
jgi:hypothetical protein